jgi:hypothetical protein
MIRHQKAAQPVKMVDRGEMARRPIRVGEEKEDEGYISILNILNVNFYRGDVVGRVKI